MTELTKEYFDQQLQNVATKEDLKGLATQESLDALARITANGFEEPQRELDVRQRMESFEHRMERICAGLSAQIR